MLLKKEKCFKRNTILEAVNHLQDIVLRKQNGEIRAIYSAGKICHLARIYNVLDTKSHLAFLE